MKILIVSYSYPPDNTPAAQRPYFIAKYLALLGHDVNILTTGASNSSLGKSNWAKPLPGVTVWDTARSKPVVHQSDEPAAPKKAVTGSKTKWIKKIAQMVLFPDKAILWFRELLGYDLGKIGKPDVVISTSPLFTNHLVAKRVVKRFKCKWIADIRDFHYTNTEREKSGGLKNRLNGRIERDLLKRADYITFVTQTMRNVYCSKYEYVKQKSMVVYNGFEPEEYPAAQNILPSDKMKIFYAGSFYDGLRDPAPLLAALDILVQKKLVDINKVEIEIAGNIPEVIAQRINQYQSAACVKFLGLIERKAAIEKMNNSHLLWLIIANVKSHYMTFPLKGFEYIGSRRHIVLFSPPQAEGKIIVEELGVGTFFNLATDDATNNENAEKLLQLYNSTMNGAFADPVKVEDEKLLPFLRKGQSMQFSNIIQSLHAAE
ncbi:MAG: glycosyltransferase family 4 protein [Chitinophagaceae bacterium]|nr:glycosyltransferase family 4 protein [Chitinophagaceae bacterium]